MASDTTAAQADQGILHTEDDLNLFKEYLAEPRFRIKLDDMVNASVRNTLTRISDEQFPLDTGRVSGPDFAGRLKSYEEAIKPLQSMAVLMGKWATPEQRMTLTSMFARVADNCLGTQAGSTLWSAMRWYPVSLLLYSAGIAALSADNYVAFAAIHTRRLDTRARRTENSTPDIILPVVDAMFDVARSDAWKCIDEYKSKYAPESEHLIKVLHPVLSELLFMGAEYERLFDRYEILRSLLYADVTDGGWAPVGRFGWKYSSRFGEGNPYSAIRAEAAQTQEHWGPVQAGLFRGSYVRFEQVAAKFETERLSRLGGG